MYLPSLRIDPDSPTQRKATVIVIDDMSTGRRIISEIIASIDKEIQVMMFSDAQDAIEFAFENEIDMVLTDYNMPELDGVEIILKLRTVYPYDALPIVVVTVIKDQDVRYRALEAGATDFMTLPIDICEGQIRCRSLLKMRRSFIEKTNHVRAMEAEFVRIDHEIRRHEADAFQRLSHVANMRDADTNLRRAKSYAVNIARGIGLSSEEAAVIEQAMSLLYIGKIGVPERILETTGSPINEEIRLLHAYTEIGYDILKYSPSNFLSIASDIALSHGERYDGSGYPSGLHGKAIPLNARIVGLAIEAERLIHGRQPYPPQPREQAIQILIAQRGGRFDPDLVDALLYAIN